MASPGTRIVSTLLAVVAVLKSCMTTFLRGGYGSDINHIEALILCRIKLFANVSFSLLLQGDATENCMFAGVVTKLPVLCHRK